MTTNRYCVYKAGKYIGLFSNDLKIDPNTREPDIAGKYTWVKKKDATPLTKEDAELVSQCFPGSSVMVF